MKKIVFLLKISLTFVLAAMLFLFSAVMFIGCKNTGKAEKAKETAEYFLNPDRGFYQPYQKKFMRENNTPVSKDTLAHYAKDYGLFHFRFGLESFSDTAGGTTAPLSEDMLNALSQTLDNLRLVDATAILRFSYDSDGNSYDSEFDPEPPLNIILTHISQLGEVLCEYTDVITAIEAGMFGPWGEQHSTAASEVPSNYFHLAHAWLEKIDNRTISLRRPLYYLYWYNQSHGTNYTIAEIENAVDINVMLGVYNDGYLGTHLDYGTYSDREKEINWLNKITKNSLFGGEVTTDKGAPDYLNNFNRPSFLYSEAPVTRTSYLNYGWNYNVVDAWRESKYKGSNSAFNGKSDYDYIAAHLGYRFILNSSSLNVSKNKIELKLEIFNSGFGNLVNQKNACLVLKQGDSISYIQTQLDARKWSGTFKEQISVPINQLNGEFEVYLKIIDTTAQADTLLRSVRFANKDIYKASLAANYLGRIKI